MGQCLGVDKIRLDLDRQKKELRTTVAAVSELRKEIDSLRQEIQTTNKDIADKLDDWVLKSKTNEKERIQKETAHHIEISTASRDVGNLKVDLRKLTQEFSQYKKDNTAILIALHNAHEARERKLRDSSLYAEEKHRPHIYQAAKTVMQQNTTKLGPDTVVSVKTADATVPVLNLSKLNSSIPVEGITLDSGVSLKKVYVEVVVAKGKLGFALKSLTPEQLSWFERFDNGKSPSVRMAVKEFRPIEGEPTTPAELAGLQIDDILEEVDAETFRDLKGLAETLKQTEHKSKVRLGLWRKVIA